MERKTNFTETLLNLCKSDFLNVFGVTLIGAWGNIDRRSKLPHLRGNFDLLLHVVFLVFGVRLVCEMM